MPTISNERTSQFTPALGKEHLTSYYDKIIRWAMPEDDFRSKLLLHLSPQKGERILEFGFGTAQNLILAAKKEPQVKYHGIDIDPKALSLAEEKLKGGSYKKSITLELYNGQRLPYRDGIFDKVFSCLVFHHLQQEEKIAALRELHRVLKTGGQMLICDWGRPSNTASNMGFYLVQMLDGFSTTQDNRKGMIPEYIRESGFANVNHVDIINTFLGTLRYTMAIKGDTK